MNHPSKCQNSHEIEIILVNSSASSMVHIFRFAGNLDAAVPSVTVIVHVSLLISVAFSEKLLWLTRLDYALAPNGLWFALWIFT